MICIAIKAINTPASIIFRSINQWNWVDWGEIDRFQHIQPFSIIDLISGTVMAFLDCMA